MQTHNHKMAEENEEGLMQQLASKYIPYWPLFLLSLIIAAGMAFVYLRYTTPIYEAKAAILIKDEKKGNEDSKMSEQLDLISSKKIVENEIEILQSRTLMVSVVKTLFLYAPVFEEGKMHPISAYIKSPIIIEASNPDSIKEFNNPDSIKKYKKIYFSYDKNSQTVI